jgi:type III secretory pathway component EscR|tara:strand:- start:927 stop:1187 length:261 start_codon:yes stop_codon:yes gene_type:complete
MENTTVFKNIECNVTQLATTMTLIDNYIKKQNEIIELYKEQLNGSSNTEEVRFYQTTIKDKKANIKSMIALQEQMSTKELITKHTL